jgi:hypothetical protein
MRVDENRTRELTRENRPRMGVNLRCCQSGQEWDYTAIKNTAAGFAVSAQ